MSGLIHLSSTRTESLGARGPGSPGTGHPASELRNEAGDGASGTTSRGSRALFLALRLLEGQTVGVARVAADLHELRVALEVPIEGACRNLAAADSRRLHNI